MDFEDVWGAVPVDVVGYVNAVAEVHVGTLEDDFVVEGYGGEGVEA